MNTEPQSDKNLERETSTAPSANLTGRQVTLIRKLLEVAVCPECDGGGQVSTPIGENFVSREMAIDAGDRSMEGQSMGIEYEHHECQFCHDRREMIAQISSPSTESTATVREQEYTIIDTPDGEVLREPSSLATTEETKTDEEIEELISVLEKYQSRYHGAEHAQELWERGEIVLRALRQKPAAKEK